MSAIAGVSVLALSLVVGSGMDALAGKGNKGGKGSKTKVAKVTEESMRGWAFYNDQADEGLGVQFEEGTGHKGTRSAYLDVDNAGGELLSTRNFAGTKLKDIKKLRYTTITNVGTTAPSLQIGVDFPGEHDHNVYQGRLVWVPSLSTSEAIPNDEWVTWNPLKHGGEAFYFTKWAADYSDISCTQATDNSVSDFCTLDEIMAAYPGLRINPNGGEPEGNNGAGTGLLGLRVGSGEGNVDANIDTVEIQLKAKKNKQAKTTVFDFGG